MDNIVVIVIIDSGVCKKHPIFKDDVVEEYIYSREKNELAYSNVQNDNKLYGHGTAIYSIIRTCRDFARIINIKVDYIENGIAEDELMSILELAHCNFHPNIVNLSLGLNICEDYKGFAALCRKITDSGCIIISAFDNTGAISYPAAFENVIGVISGVSCRKINQFEYIEDTVVNIAAKGSIQRVAWSYPDYIMIEGNSFACAHVTVQTAKYMAEGAETRRDILDKFKKNSVQRYRISQEQKEPERVLSIRKAALFPFNKEMHGLVRFHHLLPFEIVDVYDVKYSGRVGATTAHLLKDPLIKEYMVKHVENIEWEAFDTLIVGHLDELSELMDKDGLRRKIIEAATGKGKQIYSFDDIRKIGYDEQPGIYCPKVDEKDLPPNRFGMLYSISKPVVGIFGTSPQQGKFTLQLKLREILLKQGYDVGQIGTEPSALLYGMDYVFPMGYNSSVYIKEFDVVRYLNHIINLLCIEEKDIILIGSQSGTVPYDTGNIIQYTIPQYDFLLGTQPDCVVMCVNPFDDIPYIMRTKNFIEASVDCKVVALVVFPMDVKDDWTGIFGSKKMLDSEKYMKIKEELSKKFEIPVFNLGVDEDMNDLTDIITDFFAGN